MKLSEKAQKTRHRILDAGMRLFYLHGYNATGLDKIIKEAKITKGNFYYHFKSKEILALATLDWQLTLMQQAIQDTVLNKKHTPLNALFTLLEFMANKQKSQYSEGYICGCYFGNFTLELSTASKNIRDKVSTIFNQYFTLIESFLIKAKETGEIASHINPKQMASIIMGQMEGAILLDKANQTPHNVDIGIQFIKQILSNDKA
jgi:TetR/AcrR family transcriptional repressor of nem operon